MKDNQKVCLGSYTSGAKRIFMRQGKSGRELVAYIEKLCYQSLPSANIQTLRIRNADSDPYFSDDKVEYVSLNESIEIGVLAALSNQPKPNPKNSKKPVKRILYHRIKEENN